MNKTELIAQVAENAGLPKTTTQKVITSLLDTIVQTVKDESSVKISGFGTFSSSYRDARTGVNPRKPSESIEIPAMRLPKFKAGTGFKKALKS